jgi:hypothetical protein
VNVAVREPAVTVTVPVREPVEVFAVAVTRNTPPLAPEVGLTDNHVLPGAGAAVHDPKFVVTVVSAVPPAAGTEPVVGLSDSDWLAAVWVTVNVAACDPAVTLTIPVRGLAEVLAVAVARNTPLLTPDVGVAESHSEPEMTAEVHDAAVVVTVVCVVPPAAGIVPVVGFNDNAPVCSGRVAVTV